MKCARSAVSYSKNDYRSASDLPTTIFGQKFSSARNFFIDPYSAVSNKFLSTYSTIFPKLRCRDIAAFRTKNWMDEQKLVNDSLQITNFTFPSVTGKNIVWSFSMPLWCNENIPGTFIVTFCYVNSSVKMKNAPLLAYYQSYSFNLTSIINHQWRKSFTSAK